MKKLFFHIGLGKAGSSSLQFWLKNHSTQLSEAGFSYLGLNLEEYSNLNKLKYDWQRPTGWPKFIAKARKIEEYTGVLLGQIKALNSTNFIISNESIFGRYEIFSPIIDNLIKDGVSVEVICVMRRPHEWLRSAYLQWAIYDKSYTGNVPSFYEWAKIKQPNFSKELQDWLTCKKIQKVHAFRLEYVGNLIAKFNEILGNPLSGSVVNASKNKSRGPQEIYLRWVLASYTAGRQSPDRAAELIDTILNLDGSVPDLHFDSLWPSEQENIEIDQECDIEVNKLNGLFEQIGIDSYPLSDQLPGSSFSLYEEQSLANLQEYIVSVLLMNASLQKRQLNSMHQEIIVLKKNYDKIAEQLINLESQK